MKFKIRLVSIYKLEISNTSHQNEIIFKLRDVSKINLKTRSKRCVITGTIISSKNRNNNNNCVL